MVDRNELMGYILARQDLEAKSEKLFPQIREICVEACDCCVGETVVDVGFETSKADMIDGGPTIYVQTSYSGDDDNYYYFPAKYLDMTLEQIAEDVEKRERADELESAKKQEEYEYNEYLRLKKKYAGLETAKQDKEGE